MMPISPERMKLYPGGSIRSPEWLAIRGRIRARANDACEGSPAYPDCRAKNGEPHPRTGSKVVCTVAHFDQDVGNNADENLFFWCQRCHNTHDLPHRQEHAAMTRHRKRGQEDFFA